MKTSRIYSLLQELRIPCFRWHGTFQSLSWLALKWQHVQIHLLLTKQWRSQMSFISCSWDVQKNVNTTSVSLGFISAPLFDMEIWVLCMTAHQSFSDLNSYEPYHLTNKNPSIVQESRKCSVFSHEKIAKNTYSDSVLYTFVRLS